MYESPIEIITKEMSLHFDDDIYRAVQEYGVEVNKDELIKALRYDRDQYDKGYRDGIRALVKRFKEEDGYNNHTFDDCASIIASTEYARGRDEKCNEVWETIDYLVKEMLEGKEEI